ncbi:uncharacterized protein LOC110921225 [Helianthus annuus]|uniref:uncharacterized protein LOC110921225 n=1 Tax=Helianthus annuus TaxID=4232 RepID=UPI000B8FAB5B|nr:uncharacterized protein LOC110921225 [Helianthus annuus]
MAAASGSVTVVHRFQIIRGRRWWPTATGATSEDFTAMVVVLDSSLSSGVSPRVVAQSLFGFYYRVRDRLDKLGFCFESTGPQVQIQVRMVSAQATAVVRVTTRARWWLWFESGYVFE